MQKKRKKLAIFTAMLALVLLCTAIPSDAATIKLNKKALTLEEGSKAKLKLVGSEKEVKWSSKDVGIAEVSATGMVTAVEAGTTSIYARVGKRQYSCKVTVLPQFQIDEEAIAEELDGRMFSVNGQKFQVQEEEIDEVKIISKSRNKKSGYFQVVAEVEIDRTIARMSSLVKLQYQQGSLDWKLKKVTTDTKVIDWNLEGIWQGGVEIYDYSRNKSEYRDLTLDIYDVSDDGAFSCEAALKDVYEDTLNMEGEINQETGELEIRGLDWIDDVSDLAKDLSKHGKIYAFYAVPDFANDAFVTNEEISTRVTFTSEMVVELEEAGEGKEEKEDNNGADEVIEKTATEDDTEDFVYE